MTWSNPSPEDWALERRIEMARIKMRYGQTAFVRTRAIREIEQLVAQRSPRMVDYLAAHPEMA